ncbi:hypothetical protein IWQ62_004049 [Dispira parvispora]|uniref:Non-specific serine/threonine protein kinase n=1 Tax=Dispira parvispora TaxID=1520584 RepID=A0A9W8E2C6_9FUNG|nr:hypothetical protein IWQ62_004049 [Dispira parvispora]
MHSAKFHNAACLERQSTKDSALASRQNVQLTSPFVLISFDWDYVQISVTELFSNVKPGAQQVSFHIEVYDSTQGFSFTRTWADFQWLNHKLRQYQPLNKLTLPILSNNERNPLSKNLFFLKSNAEKVEKYIRRILAEPFLRCTPELFEFMSPKPVVGQPKTSPLSKLDKAAPGLNASTYKKPTFSIEIKQDSQLIECIPNTKPGLVKLANDSQIDSKVVTNDNLKPYTEVSSTTTTASLENFDLIKVIGRGCMGKVFLARDKTTDELVAIKSISKEKVLRQNEIGHILGERDILTEIADSNHPYLMKLRYSFQNEGQLFLVLDYLPGGDIATQLARYFRFSEDRVRFYAAEIILGLEQLHNMGIIYRDLKPENMLLDRQGHLLLTDFGLSKKFTPTTDRKSRQRTKTFCGTAEYLAPEMLRGEAYDRGIDFWSLGTCMYEMVTGTTPFWAENHGSMYQRVLFDRLQFPGNTSPEFRSLVIGLLTKDPRRRLGNGQNGIAQLKTHPFFANISWEDFTQRKVPAPFVPPIAHDEDVSNFEEMFIKMPVQLAATNREYLRHYYLTNGYLKANGSFKNPFARYDYVSRFLTRSCSQQPVQPSLTSHLLASLPVSPTRSQQPVQNNLYRKVNLNTLEQLQRLQKNAQERQKVFKVANSTRIPNDSRFCDVVV